ncbi:MAG: cytochrome c family protein [Sedimentisphaerales bacterium]|nr:cytochrome c family protein [Sedimentisphaerales bacterium]
MRSPKKTAEYEKEPPTDDSFTVFLTGNELGALKPCGCSGGQLGGLDRRPAVLNAVPEDKRLIIDTGSFVNGDSEQDLIKYHIIIQALQLLDYDLVSLSEQDIETGRNLGLLEGIESTFNMISSYGTSEMNIPAKFTKEFSLKGRTVLSTVAAFDPESTPVDQIEELFALPSGMPSLNILILSKSDPETIKSITNTAQFVDCVVCPSESDEPAVIGNPNGRPLAFTVGRFGRYVCGLKVTAPPRVGQPLRLAFKAFPVEEDLPKDESLVKLYGDYQQIVKDRNLLEKHPRFALPNGLEYTGSKSCKPCHGYEYETWSNNAHAKAFSTLEQVNSQFDPECVVCHVIGLDYESGFISQQKTGHLINVGCENCHGSGSEHILTAGATELTEPKSTCLDCHTPEQSGDYAGNEDAFMEKIKHWREPNAAGNVK